MLFPHLVPGNILGMSNLDYIIIFSLKKLIFSKSMAK